LHKIHPSEGLTVWFTGLSAAGKTTLSNALFARLETDGIAAEQLDGDVIRKHLSAGLGFSKADREEHVRRIVYLASMLTRHNIVVLVSVISPYASMRAEARERIPNFLEVYVHAPLAVCESRDPKGLYKRARAGELAEMTGIGDPYEEPPSGTLTCHTHLESVSESVEKVLTAIYERLGRVDASEEPQASLACR
jgi:adenylylsulfate kinase